MLKWIKLLNVALGLLVLSAGLASLGFGGLYGAFIATVSAAIAFGVFRHNRWAYFASAAWGLAGYQLAKEGLEFETLKRTVMVLGIAVVVVSVFLHEKLARPKSPQV